MILRIFLVVLVTALAFYAALSAVMKTPPVSRTAIYLAETE